jgi:3-deoxy-7-phosphoheptulonate synthase
VAYKVIKKLPDSEQIMNEMPLSDIGYKYIERHRQEVKNILNGTDKRLLIIVGPCSAWPSDAVLEYARRLNELNDKVKDNLKLVMRLYIQKPRTIKGWTGPVNQPDPLLPPDIALGIKYARNLMIKVTEMGLPIADEALFTHNARGFLELLSWVAIGARSSEDQEHRIFASSIDCPVGMKNPTHGSLKIGVNGVIAAQNSHVAVLDGYEVKTDGNPYVHIVLRGSNNEPNYSVENLTEVKKYLDLAPIKNPAVMIDVSHDNCLKDGKKDHNLQEKIIFDVIESIKDKPELNGLVKGFMIESFLKPGNQNVEKVDTIDLDGLSITDPCIGWEQTEDLLIKLSKIVGKDVL